MHEKIEMAKCPICGRISVFEYRPFCSKKCADIDLGRWLKGVYATPATDQTPLEKDENSEE